MRHVESVKDSATKIAVVETIIFLAEGSAKGSHVTTFLHLLDRIYWKLNWTYISLSKSIDDFIGEYPTT